MLQHYADPNYKPVVDRFLDPEVYGRALDSIVKACVDIAIVDDDGQVLLGRRRVHPHPDWWLVGGRMFPGESPPESAARIVKRECALDGIELRRFDFLRVVSYTWSLRAQPPESNGTADIVLIYALRLTKDECAKIRLEQNEYDSHRWISASLQEDGFHPALKDTLALLFLH